MNKVLKQALATAGAVLGLAGCGAPDLAAMSPHVWKPTSEVLLVDHPPNWQATDVEQTASNASVVANVKSISSNQLVSQLNTSLAAPSVGLYVIVLNGMPPNQLWTIIQNHPSIQFELIGSSGTPPALRNLRVIETGVLTEAYFIGWTTGQLALRQAQPQVAWDLDGTSSLSKAEIEAALAGLYAANPAVSIVPLSLSQVQKNPGFGFTMPRLVLAPAPLSAATQTFVTANGVGVISLVPSATAIVQPQTVPAETVLTPDFAAYQAKTWKAGLLNVQTPDVSMQVHQVPATFPGTVKAMAPLVTQSLAEGAWKQVPASLQLLWQPIVNLGF